MKNIHDVQSRHGFVTVDNRSANLVAMDRDGVLSLIAFLLSKHNLLCTASGVITSDDIIQAVHEATRNQF